MWFKIDEMEQFIEKQSDIFRPADIFSMFARLAFVNKRTPDKQIIGEENYWVCKVDNNNNLIEGNVDGGINLIAK